MHAHPQLMRQRVSKTFFARLCQPIKRSTNRQSSLPKKVLCVKWPSSYNLIILGSKSSVPIIHYIGLPVLWPIENKQPVLILLLLFEKQFSFLCCLNQSSIINGDWNVQQMRRPVYKVVTRWLKWFMTEWRDWIKTNGRARFFLHFLWL